jgi:hypothetical protein
MIHCGKEYRPGFIPEAVYEDYIDIAYGRGEDLRNTLLWKDSYERGFVCPDGYGKWLAFAYDGKRHLFLGTFPEEKVFPHEEEDWYDYRERMFAEADRKPSPQAVDILRSLYLDGRNGRPDPRLVSMAKDPACLKWFSDYWDYVRWNEHGNECSLSEVGFEGFADCILDPEPYLEYLLPEGDETDDGKILAEKLKLLHRRYAG